MDSLDDSWTTSHSGRSSITASSWLMSSRLTQGEDGDGDGHGGHPSGAQQPGVARDQVVEADRRGQGGARTCRG